MSTIHIEAKKQDVSKYVLMVGDPLRAKYYASKFLKNFKLINNVRGMFGYTGFYKDIKITLLGHGMGIGSMGIYSYELFNKDVYDVDIIVRMGSCGALNSNFKIFDILIVEKAYSECNYGKELGINENLLISDPKLINIFENVAKELKINTKKSFNLTTNNFYSINNFEKLREKTKCDSVEMEAFALTVNSIFHNKKSLTILTVSDDTKNNNLSAKERETKLNNMFLLGANALLEYSKNKTNI